jgi:ferredoxin
MPHETVAPLHEISVDDGKCRGYTNCVVAAPDVFVMNELSGLAVVLNPHVATSDLPRMRKVVRLCPAKAIELRTNAETASND